MEVDVLAETLAICRLRASDRIPSWALELHEGFVSITRTPDELSIVCPQDVVPPDTRSRRTGGRSWSPGRSRSRRPACCPRSPTPLAEAGIPIFAISTYDTDYVLVREGNVQRALQALHADPERQPDRVRLALRARDRVLARGPGRQPHPRLRHRPVMPDGGCPESTAAQARRCWEIVLAALAEAGAGASDVVRTRTLLTPAADAEGAMAAHGEVFGDVRPASTMVVVHALLDPRWTVEVEAEAQLDA